MVQRTIIPTNDGADGYTPKWLRISVAYSYAFAVVEERAGITEGGLGSFSLTSLPTNEHVVPTSEQLLELIRGVRGASLYESGSISPIHKGNQIDEESGYRRLAVLTHFQLIALLQTSNIRARARITKHTVPKGPVGMCIELNEEGEPIETPLPAPEIIALTNVSQQDDLLVEQSFEAVSADLWRGDELEDGAARGMSWTGPIPDYRNSSLNCGIDCGMRYGARTPYQETRLNEIELRTKDLLREFKRSKPQSSLHREVPSQADCTTCTVEPSVGRREKEATGNEPVSENQFRHNGNNWKIRYNGKDASTGLTKGAAALALLLSHPNEYISIDAIYAEIENIEKGCADPKSINIGINYKDAKKAHNAVNGIIATALKGSDVNCPELRHHILGKNNIGGAVDPERRLIRKLDTESGKYTYAYAPGESIDWDTSPVFGKTV